MKIKNKKHKIILQWILIIAIIFVIRSWQYQNLINENSPIFHSKNIIGNTISSVSNEPVLIHFWATWCGICKIENSNIQSIAKDYKVLNIAISSGSDENIINYANKHNMQLENIINDNRGSLANIFGVNATPVSFVVFQNKIKFIEVGYTTTWGLVLRLWLSKWL